MLDSVKISRRQSEIRQSLAELVNKETPSDDETSSMGDLDKEYRTNETRFRAALVSEDDERGKPGPSWKPGPAANGPNWRASSRCDRLRWPSMKVAP